MDKTKFTRDPQLDSEGFVDPAAACRGCEPDEPCPRSGHCERYNSPLRFERILANIHRDGINWDRVNNPEQYAKLDDYCVRLANRDLTPAEAEFVAAHERLHQEMAARTEAEEAERIEIKKRFAQMALDGTLFTGYPVRKPGGKVATFSSLLHDWKKVVR